MHRLRNLLLTLAALVPLSCHPPTQTPSVQQLPNIVLVYADDLGYGDVGCYGARGVQTPEIDSLAAQGLRFTDAHCTAATCTPSRFSLLTGSYAFRNEAAILPGDAPLLIRPGTPTLPAMLRRAGYETAVVGKWHLGLGNGVPDWNGNLAPGPLEVGFDYAFIIPATLDRVPTVFVENHRVAGLDSADPIGVSYTHRIGRRPTGLERPDLLKFGADSQHSGTITNGISRIGYMRGGEAALWKDEDMAMTLVGKAKTFIDRPRDKPFFLYFALTDIHVPRAPHERFRGLSSMGSRGDAIAQMDWTVGRIREALEARGLTENTLLIFTSDNGPVLDDGYQDSAVALVGAHHPGGPFQGGKYSAYEAGTRVPTIVYWPGTVQPGTSSALLNQVDLFASLAALCKQPLDSNAAPDSFDMLDSWTGRRGTGRTLMLEESYTMSLRQGPWKYIAPQTRPTPDWMRNKQVPSGLMGTAQLYDLSRDTAEQHNLAAAQKEKAVEMQQLLKNILEEKGTRYKK